MLENIFYYPVFICQIFVLSYYFPNKILARANYIFEHYPANEYPRLYTQSEEKIKRSVDQFRAINRVLFAGGYVFLLAVLVWDLQTEAEINQLIPWAYFMLQMVPLILAEVFEFKRFKEMRKLNAHSKRSAELVPRRLFDYVSPMLVAGTLGTLAAVAVFLVTVFGFTEKAWMNFGVLVAGNVVFALIIAWQVYGRKLDPHQASADRRRQVEIVCKSLLYMSIAVSAYVVVVVTVDTLELMYVSATLMSIYCQAIAFISPGIPLHTVRIDEIDFEVYRAGATG